MKTARAVLGVLFLLTGLSSLSAQAFFPARVPGTFEVAFLPPAGGEQVQVSIDDQFAGTLPLTVYVRPGPHKFTFFAGDESKSIVYPVKGNTQVPSVFTPRGYPLTVNTNVPGASLAVDGRPFGGNSTMVSAGNHTLTVSAPGYQMLNMPFNQPNSPNVLNLTLVGNTFPLTVNVNPPGAYVAVDGAPLNGNTTSVAQGDHTLTVNAPGYQTLVLPFSQPASQNILNVTLIASTGFLQVDTDRLPRLERPYRLFINGNETGFGPQSLSPGSYMVRLTSGSVSIETNVSITAGQTLTLRPFIQWDAR